MIAATDSTPTSFPFGPSVSSMAAASAGATPACDPGVPSFPITASPAKCGEPRSAASRRLRRRVERFTPLPAETSSGAAASPANSFSAAISHSERCVPVWATAAG